MVISKSSGEKSVQRKEGVRVSKIQMISDKKSHVKRDFLPQSQ